MKILSEEELEKLLINEGAVKLWDGHWYYIDVRENGTVINTKTGCMSAYYNTDGYLQVCVPNAITGKYKWLLQHRIVAYVYCENDDPETKIEVDHINGIRDDNRAENLEWVTHAENMRRMKERNYRKKCKLSIDK